MTRRLAAITLALAMAISLIPAAALATGPEIVTDSYTDRFHDDFIFDMCGIDTWTTIIERWTLKTWPDGSQTFQDVRTFIPDDPRIPIEKGAGTGRFLPDGTKIVNGKPLQLFDRDGGILLLGTGLVRFDPFGDVLVAHGHDEALGVDLAEYYCP
jgi:hypothetical protein